MDGTNILYGDIDELKTVRDELKALEDVKKKVDDFTLATQRLEKDVRAEEKLMSDIIDSTVKKRREQVVENFDKEIKKAQDRLKKIRGNRDKVKNKRMNERIKLETDDFVQENKNLKEEIKTYYRQKRIPAVFNWDFLYGLVFFVDYADYIRIAVIALLSVFGIPSLVVNLLHIHVFFEVILFMLMAAVVPFLYVLLFRYARMDNRGIFIEKRELYYKIRKNKRQIKRITKSIHKDKDEESYDLGSYDDDIDDLEDSINDMVRKKNQVLSKFETITKPEIIDEITERETPHIEALKVKLNQAQLELKSYSDSQQKMSVQIASNYAAYIGNENMTLQKIDRLMDIMKDGRAKTIGDAVNIAKEVQ